MLCLKNLSRVSKPLSLIKVGDRFRITIYKNIISKNSTEKWSKGIFMIDSVLKTNPWTYKIKDLNEEKNIYRYYY